MLRSRRRTAYDAASWRVAASRRAVSRAAASCCVAAAAAAASAGLPPRVGSAGTPGCAPAAFCTASCSLDIPSSSAGSDALESDDVVERLTAAASASSRIISAPLICAIALRSTDSASPESVRPSSMSPPFLSSLSEPGALESGAVASSFASSSSRKSHTKSSNVLLRVMRSPPQWRNERALPLRESGKSAPVDGAGLLFSIAFGRSGDSIRLRYQNRRAQEVSFCRPRSFASASRAHLVRTFSSQLIQRRRDRGRLTPLTPSAPSSAPTLP